MGVRGTSRGLTDVILPQPDKETVFTRLGVEDEGQLSTFSGFIRRCRDYFDDKQASFTDLVDLSGGTSFQQRVWKACRLIPAGTTRSYGDLANEIGSPGAARAVGNALGKNPVPLVIPCHRVIASDGSPGGFSAGLKIKELMLEIETTA